MDDRDDNQLEQDPGPALGGAKPNATDPDQRAASLRRSAELRLGETVDTSGTDDLNHELEVRRAELEIQNEELREAEQSLEVSRQEFFALYDLAPVGYLTIDAQGTIGRSNIAAADMLGSDRARLPGRPLSSFLDKGEARPFFDHLANVLGAKTRANCALRFKSQSGGVFAARVTSTIAPPSLDSSDQIFLTIVDITESVLAQEAVKDSEERLRAIVDNAPLGIALLDDQNRTIECNEVFEALVEQRSYQLLGHRFADLFEGTDRAALRVLLSGQENVGESELRIKPRAKQIRAWSTTVDSGSGREPKRLVLMQDLTQHRRAEQRANFLEGELFEAHQEKLHVLGQLAGGIAHDFNNMLAAIMAFSESAMLSKGLPEEVRTDLTGIREASLRARSLVRRVLTFARSRKPNRGPANLADLVKNSIALVRGAAPSRVQFEFSGPAESFAFVDEGQIEQAIVNILTNAVQALGASPGTVRAEIRTTELTRGIQSDASGVEPGSYWRLSIRDDGPGIEPGVLERIFEPYFTTRQQSGGCGMGLATCQAVIEVHGGTVEVSSEPNLGTEFRIFLRKHTDRVEEEMTPPRGPSRFEGNILVVDDEKLVLKSCHRVLSGLGVEVECCSSARDAEQLIERSPGRFDLVISDLSMPEISGIRLAARINQISPDLPILILTGDPSRIDQDELGASRIAGVVEKPLAIREISDELVRIGLTEKASDSSL